MEKMFTAADFDTEVLGSDKPVLVDFFATCRCGPCQMMAPAVEKLAEEYEGRAVIGKLDVEESMDIAGRYGVMNVPTLILFKRWAGLWSGRWAFRAPPTSGSSWIRFISAGRSTGF